MVDSKNLGGMLGTVRGYERGLESDGSGYPVTRGYIGEYGKAFAKGATAVVAISTAVICIIDFFGKKSGQRNNFGDRHDRRH